MTYDYAGAYNRLINARMAKPQRPHYSDYPHLSEWYPAYYRYLSEMKVWTEFAESVAKVRYVYTPPKLTHATEKGIPVPRLRKSGRRKFKNGSGVSANSRVLSHRYADEGEKGKGLRREIRRKEKLMWHAEANQELTEELQDDYDWTDYMRLTDPHDYEWHTDY